MKTTEHPTPERFLPLHSEADASVNWVKPISVGTIEARFVRRSEEYIVAYLSSQSGCRQACRMCHLTATGQTALRDVTPQEYFEQADVILAHYRQCAPAKSVHFNFMARGEPLSNPHLVASAADILDGLWRRAEDAKLRARFLVSTIMPKGFDRPLLDVFDRYQPELYYSLYSMDDAFRRRWLPKAQPVAEALDRIVDWQRQSYKLVKIHFAFIEGLNDSVADVHAICDAIETRGLLVHVNIVRYNPPSAKHGQESPPDVLERNAALFRSRLKGARVQIVPRVGFDVQASCGMFVEAAS